MAVTFELAPEVEVVASELIPQYHRHLDGVRIEYVFRSKHAKKNGKLVMGTCRLVSGLNAFLASDEEELELGNLLQGDDDATPKFFVIEIAKDLWKDMSPKQRVALVDHELSHAYQEDGELSILPHDVEEFAHIVRRYGLWKGDVEAFFAAAGQHALPLEVVEGG